MDPELAMIESADEMMFEDIEGKGEVESDDYLSEKSEQFVGFSPPSSPGKSEAHRTAKELECEIKRLDAKTEEKVNNEEEKIDTKKEKQETVDDENIEIKLEEEISKPALEKSRDAIQENQGSSHEVDDALTTENSATIPSEVSPQSIALSFNGRKQRRSSRGSSPADSVSSRGSVRRSVSVSSRDSKGSQKSPATGAMPLTRYHLPFEHGWRREVLLTDTNSEVTYLHPSGLKLRSLREVSENLTSGLSVENFTFTSEPLNVSPEYEKITKQNLSAVRKSKRMITPSSNYKIVEMREVQSKKHSDSPMAPPPKRAKIVLKLNRSSIEKLPDVKEDRKSFNRIERADESVPHQHPEAPRGPLRKVTPGHISSSSEELTYMPEKVKPAPRKHKHPRKKASTSEGRARKISEGGWDSEKSSSEEPRRICSIACPNAMGLIPTLQCCICLCLFHPECAEVPRTPQTQNIQSYICKSCRGKPEVRKPKMEADVTVAPVAPTPTPAPAPTPPVVAPPPVQPVQSVPQILVSVNRRRFIMVPDLSTPPAATPATNRPIMQQPLTADVSGLNANTDISLIKPDGATIKKLKLKEGEGSQNFMRNLCSGYTALLHVFEYLTTKELLQAAQVCHLWRDLAHHETLWRVVRVKKFTVKDWKSFAIFLSHRGTMHLDLRDTRLSVDNSIYDALPLIRNLERLDLGYVLPRVLHSAIKGIPSLGVCSALLSRDREGDVTLRLDIFSKSYKLEKLEIQCQDGSALQVSSFDLTPIASTLRSLALLSLSGWKDLELSSFSKLGQLTDLELGDCSTLPPDFPNHLLSLKGLRRIRLERVTEPCPCVPLVDALSSLPELCDVELINIDVRSGFDVALGKLRNIQKLLLIPTYVSQSATTISLILQGAYLLRESLCKLTWIFTEELLKITELYLDQMADHPIRGGNCVPILTPVPAPEIKSNNPTLWTEVAERYSGSSGTVAVVPLDKLHEMLISALPATKTRVMKLAFQNTCRRIEELDSTSSANTSSK